MTFDHLATAILAPTNVCKIELNKSFPEYVNSLLHFCRWGEIVANSQNIAKKPTIFRKLWSVVS